MSTPVISTDVGDIAYVLKQYKCGYVVKPSAINFINKIFMIKKNNFLKKNLSKNARKNILKNFNIRNYRYKLEKEFLY